MDGESQAFFTVLSESLMIHPYVAARNPAPRGHSRLGQHDILYPTEAASTRAPGGRKTAHNVAGSASGAAGPEGGSLGEA